MAINKVQAEVNGVITELIYNSSTGFHEKTISAPSKSSYNINSGHYYPITVKAIDSAGNSIAISDTDAVLGNKLRLQVKEIVAPVSTITYPTESQIMINVSPTVTWKVIDNDSGVNPSTIGITIDNSEKITAGITKTAISGGYQCSYGISGSLEDGTHTVKVDAQDYDGNNAVQRSVNFVVDTVPPELSVVSPINNLITNQPSVVVSGEINDVTSGIAALTVSINEAAPVNVQISSGRFSRSFTLSDGENIIVVTATDNAGKKSSISRTVILDQVAPVISHILVTPNPVSTGEIITISVRAVD